MSSSVEDDNNDDGEALGDAGWIGMKEKAEVGLDCNRGPTNPMG